METLTLIALVIILVLVISIKSSTSEYIQNLQKDIWRLRDQIQSMERLLHKNTETPAAPAHQKPVPAKDTVKDETEILEQRPHPPVEARPVSPPVSISQTSTVLEEEKPKPYIENKTIPAKSSPPSIPPKPGFFERNPDLEKFIGENLVSKIGIAILVLAIGFFVKYAIDNEWIGTVGRVAIGILCGGVLVTFAHLLRKNYKAFSGVLIGGGIAVFYFTIALAFHEYRLFTQPVAFSIMTVITIFAVVLSLLYDRQDTAIISLVGGFAAPFMVSNGSNNYMGLFTYLTLLNAGLLFIAYRKAWRLLNLLAFIFTVVLFAAWMALLPSEAGPEVYQRGWMFATIFYLLFFAINIANNIKENKRFIASDFGILLVNTALYFAVGLYCVEMMGKPQYKGFFSAALAALNLVATYLLMRSKKIDSNILYLLIGITLTFVSITAPLQLNGHYITIFWASEMVLLYWLYRKSNIPIIQISSLIIGVAMLLSLLMDWATVYFSIFTVNYNNSIPIVFNKGFMTGIYCAAALLVLRVLYKKPSTEFGFAKKMQTSMLRVLLVAFPIVLFITGYLEIDHQVTSRLQVAGLQRLYLLLYALAFSFVYLRVSNAFIQTKKIVNMWCCILITIYLLCLPATMQLQRQLLFKTGSTMPHFMAHWLSAVLLMGTFYLLAKYMAGLKLHKVVGAGPGIWILALAMVVFVSCECMMLVNSLFYAQPDNLERLQTIYIRTGLPILWGACSFVFMWVGMKYKYRTLRIISLCLFSITLVKLFTYDIQNISPAGKIAAFFCLGVLLLVVSFMYQRLKKIIIEDEKTTAA
ncbi:MAG: DUF2339 domain-containing protein [Bacteroidota bacterium]